MMRTILSPAKTMRIEEVISAETVPVFLDQAEEIVSALKELTPGERRKVWNCSERLAAENEIRLACMNLRGAVYPALYSYSGLAFSHLSPESLEDSQLAYLQDRLRILSGLYGILKPLDGIVPYRLEMAARLPVSGKKNLYDWWGDRLYEELYRGTDTVINLASSEYSSAVTPWLRDPSRMIHIVFAEKSGSSLKTKGTFAKMARGEMTRWLAETQADDPQMIKTYDRGYRYEPSASDEIHWVFVRTTGKESNR